MSDHASKASHTVTEEDFGFAALLNMTSDELWNLWNVLVDRSDIYSMVFKGVAIGLILGVLRKLVKKLSSGEDNQGVHEE